ncbi:MAG: histidine phosphatase family protein [Acidocella sp.]|nr:histidine phosphatase family protein [Acidocella sp.]
MSLPPVAFWFLRHGETDYNARGLSQGALDISLNENGRAQAIAAGPKLVGQGIVSIISSPMIRTRETTACVNACLGLEVGFEPGLREVIFGGMEGKPLMPWFLEWLEGRYTPPGAESFEEVKERVADAMARVLAQPSPVLVVAHGGVFRALRELMGLARTEGIAQNAEPLFCDPGLAGWQISAK